jgi:squalene-hopene/tetraprenyl-beta-curcumene cyclase
LPYRLARPALRRRLRERAPAAHETGLLDAIRRRLPCDTPGKFDARSKEPLASQKLGVEAVLSALLLAREDAGRGRLSPETGQAFERLWALQIREGEDAGSWRWTSAKLEPWEEPESAFFGAALAAVAAGSAPMKYRDRPAIRPHREALAAYLRGRHAKQPLHHRLILAWASSSLPGLLTAAERKAIVRETLNRQRADGGFTVESLGPWREHPGAPRVEGSSAYATGLAAFTLQRAGVRPSNAALQRALAWLRARQNPQGGYWDAVSMNKAYDPESIPAHFMREAATAFAVLALTGSR